MAKGIITENDLFKEKIVNDIISNIPNIEQNVIDNIFSFIDKLDSAGGLFTNGVITTEQLYNISQIIDQALRQSGYYKSVDLFMSDFGKVTINTTKLLSSVGGYSFQQSPLSNMEKKWKSQTYETLINSGINESFKRPILKILDDIISYGNSIESAKKSIIDFVKSGKDKSGKLKSYVTQTARDSVNQLQGQQLQSIANNIETELIRYVGGTLSDTRGHCYRWVRELNGRILYKDLDAEIKLAYKNEKLKLERPEKHKWSGMMPDTTVNNFCTKRGGFNCTHTAVPVRKK